MHKVFRVLGLSQHILEQLSRLWHEAAMRRVRVVPGKHGMADILELKEAEIREEAIPVNMHQG